MIVCLQFQLSQCKRFDEAIYNVCKIFENYQNFVKDKFNIDIMNLYIHLLASAFLSKIY